MPLPVVPVTTKSFLRPGQIIEVVGKPEKNIPRLFAVAHIDKSDKQTAYLCFPLKEISDEKAATLDEDAIVIRTARTHSAQQTFAKSVEVNKPPEDSLHMVMFEKPAVSLDRAKQTTEYTIHAGKELLEPDAQNLRAKMNEIMTSDLSIVEEYKSRYTQEGSSGAYSHAQAFGNNRGLRTNRNGHTERRATDAKDQKNNTPEPK